MWCNLLVLFVFSADSRLEESEEDSEQDSDEEASQGYDEGDGYML